MDAHGQVYADLAEHVPAEDRERLAAAQAEEVKKLLAAVRSQDDKLREIGARVRVDE